MNIDHAPLVGIISGVFGPKMRSVADSAIAHAVSRDRWPARHGSGQGGDAAVHTTERRWPTVDHTSQSVTQKAGWRDLRTGVLLAAIIAATLVAILYVSDSLWPAAGGNPSGEVERMVGVRLLPQSAWRSRNETGSVAGEKTERESGEPADEATMPAAWSDANH